ncbi:hypothetical protein BG005_003915 [Podila minutissima]|nr:hypothetical protein BG005_003915 [Podila minutissima]
MDAPPSFATLPLEVQNMILQYIGLSELPVCPKINNVFKSIVTPLIWRTLDIKTKKQSELFMRIETQQALKRNSGYVRDLHIDVENMAVYRNIFTKQKIGLDANATICFTELRNSTRLYSLTMAIKEMICTILTLRRLWVVAGLDRERMKLLLSVLPETIEDITFRVDNMYDEQTNVPKAEEGAMPSLPALRMIAFKGSHEGVGNSVLLPLLRACTKLISFETTTIQPFCDENCRAVLANLGKDRPCRSAKGRSVCGL